MHFVEPARFERNTTWTSSSQSKIFNPGNAVSKTWSKEGNWRQADCAGSSERWNTGNSRNTNSSSSFTTNSNVVNVGATCPPPPGINNYINDRFDYKSGIGGIRKY